MALISCPECQKEISDQAVSCPYCGFPISEKSQQETRANREPSTVDSSSTPQEQPQQVKRNSRKKLIISIVAVILVIIAVVVGVLVSKHNAAVKAAEEAARAAEEAAKAAEEAARVAAEARANYISTLELARIEMLAGAAEAETVCNIIANVWHDTIYEEFDIDTYKYTKTDGIFNKDFNVSLGSLFSSEEYTGHAESITASKDKVDAYMKQLQSPPDDLETPYDTVYDLYEQYVGFTGLALSPKGSLTTFNQAFQEYETSFMQLYDKLGTQIPDE